MTVSESSERVVDKQKQRLAHELLTSFFILSKTARLYESDNESYLSHADQFFEKFHQFREVRHSTTIKMVRNRFFADDQFVNIIKDDRIGVYSVIERWAELGIGGLIIGDTVNPEQMDIFIHLLWTFEDPEGDPFRKLAVRLTESGVDSISLMPRQKFMDRSKMTAESRRLIRQQTRDTFFRSIGVVKEALSAASQDQKIPVARTKRVVHSIIDQITEDEAALIELASIKDYDEYTYAHCTNVCIYSVTLGFHLGLGRKELAELGFAALFHDIGKIKLPNDLITKPDRYDEYDWAQMHQHPVLGAMTVAKTLRLDSNSARAMAVAFEHHINPDYSGYPQLPEPRPINLYARIVSIADSFDALTSGRVYIKNAIPPDEVLRKLMYQMKAKFDEFLMRIFVGIVGIYPIGTLVLLNDDSFAIITRTNPDFLHRPEVRVIADRQGERKEVVWVDLADESNGDLDIVRIIDPKKYDLDMSRYILND
ncbi:MAG: HD domain-containing protein [FCB group bacterium]|nr:HD domain-containing protein [FCB group bacterium]